MRNKNSDDAPVSVPTESKRGRGRPRKPIDPEAENAPKRGRGRPRKPVAESEANMPKRGRGRPRKDASESSTVPEVSSTSAEFPVPFFRPRKTTPEKQVARAEDQPKQAAPAKNTKVPLFGKAKQSEKKPEVVAEQPQKPAGRQSKRTESKPEEAVAKVPTAPFVSNLTSLDGEPLPTPLFRTVGLNMMPATKRGPKQAKPTQATEDSSAAPVEEPTEAPVRKVRQSRRGEKREAAIQREQTAPEPVVVAEPEPVKVETREIVRVPADAPQVTVRDGVPTLVRDGRVFPPLFFFGSVGDEHKLENILEQVKMASEVGVHVFILFVELEVNDNHRADDAVKLAGYLTKQITAVDPQAQLIFRVVFTAASNWEQKYKQGRYVAENGGVPEPSISDDEFWMDAEACLVDFVQKTQKLDTGKNVMGVHLERGEWFFASGWGYDQSPAAQEAFRKWVRLRYRNDSVALCASWFDGQVQFDTVSVPEYLDKTRAGEEFVRTGRKSQRWVDYHLFLSDSTVERIGRLAHAAKKASDGYFLVGVSYGYSFEWSHPANGHLSLGKLLRNPEVDFIAGPPSYKNREPGGSSPFPGPVDSFALNGKLYVSEEDFKTPISGKFEPDDFNPVMKTPQALETVHWRGAGSALAHSSGVCWMDLWGNGWLKTHGIWERGKDVLRSLVTRMAAPPADPEVAVFIDERSLSYLVDERAFSLLVQNVRESILRSGLSVGFYLLSDLAHREHFPEAKLYVFLNAWDIRPEVRSAIKSRLQRDGKVLFWMYAAGLFDGGRDALERVREVTGIALKRQPFACKSGTSIVHRKHPLCEALPERNLNFGGELEPSYFAIPEDSVVLGEYTSTGLPSYVVRDFQGEEPGQSWTSVFLGEPVVTPALFRALGQMAGAHVWNYVEDVVHVRAPFVTVHCRGAGPRTLAVPDKASVYNLQRSEWCATEASQHKFVATDGSTHLFLVGIKSEIEAILSTAPDSLLKIEELPEKPENTINLDEIHFDVPIMRMDSWVEDSWNEELADVLVVKPSSINVDYQLADEDGSGSSSDRRNDRRHQRRRKNRRPNESKGGTSRDFDVKEMNVVFRKRN